MSKRREFSRQVMVEIVKRAMDANGRIRCENCHCVVKGKQYEIDHTIPEELRIDKSKKLTAAEGMLLCIPCHRAPETGKTAADIKIIAKAKRNESAHLGIERPKQKIPSRPSAQKQRAEKLPVPGPRALFKKIEVQP